MNSPRIIEFVDELPKTPAGKINRKVASRSRNRRRTSLNVFPRRIKWKR